MTKMVPILLPLPTNPDSPDSAALTSLLFCKKDFFKQLVVPLTGISQRP
ncbi:hypothetical protein Enr10x_45520 [Gimesia panareensis]|uniref:Uncharacterized protein n=1 Tax=Gimesia panareensis TaxID=2527978 RepID=A0A517QC50_9PLAN|nr:hypothetical protein Enr10x_45520 [Gimesia panareensis]